MTDDPTQGLDPNAEGWRPMIAILKARPGMERRLRAVLLALVKETRQEAGCVKFILYQAMKSEGTFYLYEVYRSNADFFVHLKSEAVARFKRELATVSNSDQMNDLTQLLEVPPV